MRTETPWGVWEPFDAVQVAAIFDECGVPWWIAGGYAIEFAVGRRFREHGDVDVLVLRRDQLIVQEVLQDWEWWAADPPGHLRRWGAGELLPALGRTGPDGIPFLGPEVQLYYNPAG